MLYRTPNKYSLIKDTNNFRLDIAELYMILEENVCLYVYLYLSRTARLLSNFKQL